MSLPPPAPQGAHAVDVVAHYDFPPNLDGRGQRIALIEIGGEHRFDDLQVYCTLSGIRVPTVIDVPFDGAEDFLDADFTALVARDVQLTAAAAPGAEIVLYRVPNHAAGIIDGFGTAVHSRDLPPTVICITWAIPEEADEELVQAVESYLQDAALLGITVCAAADLTQGFVPYPASSPFALACGTTGSESGEGGGPPAFSNLFEAGVWGRERTQVSGTPRMLPDVVCAGGNEYPYRFQSGGEQQAIGDAGSSACLWAGLVARLNQGLPRSLGLWTTELYTRLGPEGALRGPETGVASGGGSRQWVPGIGWGSPDGRKLLAAMQGM